MQPRGRIGAELRRKVGLYAARLDGPQVMRDSIGRRPTMARMTDIRARIIATYAEWTALSALRSGAPIKSRADVYSVLRACDFGLLFDKKLGPIAASEFNHWHRNATQDVLARERRLTVGWATKIINVYLKTRAYIGAQGRHHLAEALHPRSMQVCGLDSSAGSRSGRTSWAARIA